MYINYSTLVFSLFFLSWIFSIFQIFSIASISISLQLVLPLLFFFKTYRRVSVTTIFATFCFIISMVIPFTLNLERVNATTFTHILQNIICISVFIVFSTLIFDDKVESKFIAILRLSILVVGIYAIYQYVARSYSLPFDYLPITNLQISADEGYQRGYSNFYIHNHLFTRVSSFFSEPSELGRFILLTFPFIFFCYSGKDKKALLLLMLISIVLTQSMGTLAIAGLMMIYYHIANGRLFLTLQAILILVLLLVIVWWGVSSYNIELGSFDRILKISELGWRYLESTSRFKDTLKVIEISIENFNTGLGIGSISDVVSKYVVSNLFLLIIIERGVFGLVFFILPLLFPIFLLAKKGDNFSLALKYCSILQILFFINFSMLYFIPMYVLLGLSYSKIKY